MQSISNRFAAHVYETHARIALESGDLPEYNQVSKYKRSYISAYLKILIYNKNQNVVNMHRNTDFSMSFLTGSISCPPLPPQHTYIHIHMHTLIILVSITIARHESKWCKDLNRRI